MRVHSNVLTGLSLAIVLARFLAWRRALRRQPRYLRSVGSSLAKIGVILVSCSCGKWSPIDADEPQPLPPSTTRKPNVVLLGHNGLVLHIFVLAWIFLYQVGASSANSNPGAGELTGRISGRLYPENPVVTDLVSEAG